MLSQVYSYHNFDELEAHRAALALRLGHGHRYGVRHPVKHRADLWLVIFVISAYRIATRCSSKYFLHGLLTSLANCVWVTGTHVLLAEQYLARHPKEAQAMASMPLFNSPRIMMLVTGPVIGLVSGVVLGIFAAIASKIMTKRSGERMTAAR